MTNFKVLIDSWGFISLFNSKDTFHIKTSEYFDDCLNKQYEFFTSNFIVSETITFLYRNFGHEKSKPRVDKLFENIESGLINCILLNEDRMKKALELRYKYHDKPKISFVDLTSMVIMRELTINEVLTMDKHFEQVNMGFELKPVLKQVPNVTY